MRVRGRRRREYGKLRGESTHLYVWRDTTILDTPQPTGTRRVAAAVTAAASAARATAAAEEVRVDLRRLGDGGAVYEPRVPAVVASVDTPPRPRADDHA